MPNWEAYAEADRRGILPPEKKALYEEAKTRGLVPGLEQNPSIPPGTQTDFGPQIEDVPEWGKENPNLYGLYGAGKALYEQAVKPTAGAIGMAGGALLGVPSGPAGMMLGAGLGQAAVNQGLRFGEEQLAGAPKQTIPEMAKNVSEDVVTGASAEVGGQLASKGLQLAGKGISSASKPIQKYFYESALKIPPSVPKALRDVAVEKGIQGQYVPSPKGLEKLKADMEAINKQIADIIEGGTQSGKTVDTGTALSKLKDLREFYKNAPKAEEYLAEIDAFEQMVKGYHGEKLPLGKAQQMKRTIYQLEKKHYGEMKGLEVESNKSLARGLKEEIVKQEPSLAKLNAEDSAMINLDNVLERAVNRIRNYDVIRWGDTFMTLTGAVVGGPGGAAAAGITKRILEDAAVKSRIAFALSKASRIKGLPVSTRVGALTAAQDED